MAVDILDNIKEKASYIVRYVRQLRKNNIY